jgi:RHS repeat-associated protein
MVSTTDYIWHRDAVRVEFDDIGIVKASYTRQPDGFSRIISQDRGGQKRFHSFDALGSTSELTDTSSSATDTFRYSAFGNEVERTGETVTPHTWIGRAGYQKDGLDRFYVRRRYFYVDQSSWLSVDPLQAASRPLSPYAYSRNSPVDRIDPSGLACYTAGQELADSALPPEPFTHTVCYNSADIAACDSGIRLGTLVARSTSPCAAQLLYNFLRQPPIDPFCPTQCLVQLDRSCFIRSFKIDDALDKQLKCCGEGSLEPIVLHYGGPGKDPFKNPPSGCESIDKDDLSIAIGAVDQSTMTVKGSWKCESSKPGECCLCAVDYTTKLEIKDKYDFVSTLPKSEATRYTPFFCAAILEHAGIGTPYTTSCVVKNTERYSSQLTTASVIKCPDK